jgi:hypothetical protein
VTDDPTPLGAMPDDDPTAIILRRALAEAATNVEPSQDGLQAIRAKTAAKSRAERRRRWVPVAAAAVVAVGLVGGGLLSQALQPDPTDSTAGPAATSSAPDVPIATTAPATPTDEATPTATPDATAGTDEPSATPSALSTLVPVYWLGASKARLWLYREFQQSATKEASVEGAVRTLLEGRPADPDYDSLWRPASSVDVTVGQDGITVDLSADAFRASTDSLTLPPPDADDLEVSLAASSVQQLVWTATAALGKGDGVAVTLLVDGAAGYEAWDSVVLGTPMHRDTGARAPIWVINPQEGQRVTGPSVKITGSGYAFEGTISWDIRHDDEVVDSGFVTTRGDGVPADFAIPSELKPGTYTVTAYQADPSDGEGPEGTRQFPDTKTFVVGS